MWDLFVVEIPNFRTTVWENTCLASIPANLKYQRTRIMAQNFHSNSQFPSDMSTAINCTANPSSEFYSIFSQEDVLGIIHALEFRREIPIRYSYQGSSTK